LGSGRRRSTLPGTGALVALVLGATCAVAQQEEPDDPAAAVDPVGEIYEEENEHSRPDADSVGIVEITPELQEAVDGGLAYLAGQQHPDGSIGDDDYRIAVTALAGLAFMANGSTVTTGRYAAEVRRAVEFFLDLRADEGKVWHIALRDDKSRLHGHGYATLFLSQAYGTAGGWSRREDLGDALRAAIALIVMGQERQGGWGYVPLDSMHEGSITVTQLQALRAARDAGIYVPAATIRDALEYLDKSKVERSDWAYFVYRLGTASSPSFPLAAAAISSLNAVGSYRSTTVEKGLAFLRRYVPGIDESGYASRDQRYEQFYYYGQLYAVQAMFQSGGDDWELWFPQIRRELLRRQEKVSRGRLSRWGEHASESRYGYEYPTAVACLILQVPYRLLPVFQR
jgi:hypothetical protein